MYFTHHGEQVTPTRLQLPLFLSSIILSWYYTLRTMLFSALWYAHKFGFQFSTQHVVNDTEKD